MSNGNETARELDRLPVFGDDDIRTADCPICNRVITDMSEPALFQKDTGGIIEYCLIHYSCGERHCSEVPLDEKPVINEHDDLGAALSCLQQLVEATVKQLTSNGMESISVRIARQNADKLLKKFGNAGKFVLPKDNT